MQKWMGWIACGAVFAATAAAPAAAVTFTNVCSPGAFKACASADVTIGPNNTLVIRVWNMSQSTGLLSDYGSATGGWHTITAIGISNIGYTLSGTTTILTAQHFDGSTYQNLTQWTAGQDPTTAQTLQIVNTGASGKTGHKEGIVGCLDPGPASADHISTCNTYPGVPYVEFTISGFSALSLNGATFEFHGQQVANANCPVFDPTNNACTADSLKGAGPPTTHVAPEPMTMILLGSGLLGVGGAARRRRRRQLELETEDA